MASVKFDRKKSAVLIMDYQNQIVTNYAGHDAKLTERAAAVLDAARSAGLPVIYVVVSFRPGHPEIANRGVFAGIKAAGGFVEGSPEAQIHPDVAPQPADVIVTKKRIGAFTGSDLEVVLRGLGSEHLILLGIATSGVVLSTVRAAADLDFELTVVADCCADLDPEVHRVLTEKVFARGAAVTTADELIASLA